jgi:hypothetical protein
MIRFSVIQKTLIVAGAAVLMALPVSAQEPASIGEFTDWGAYKYKNDKGPVCFIVSQPKDSSPKNVKRDAIHFMVTHRPAENVDGQVHLYIGYPFKKESTVKVTIDGAAFTLYTSGDGAWSDGASSDRKIVQAMRAGAKMVVEGTSWRGTQTKDSYSLSGVTAALEKIGSSCK